MMNPLFLSLTTLLLLITTTTATPKIGVIFNPIPATLNLPPLDSVITALVHHNISSVRLINPTPSSIHAFSNTDINLLISIPYTFLETFATNQSSAATWITEHILPFYKTTRISLISIDSVTHITHFHLPSLRNLYANLHELGIGNIPVSITFRFEEIVVVRHWFLPSQSVFYKRKLTRDLVRFLKSINSPFLVNLYPYDVLRSGYDAVPAEFALFENYWYNNRTDGLTGIEYWNLFDMMVDALGFALEGVGEGNVRVIVAETGWPVELRVGNSDAWWAQLYLKGLMDHLKKSSPKRVDEVYIYELFGDDWGIMDQEMRLKYKGLDFQVQEATSVRLRLFVWGVVFVSVVIVIVGVWKYGKLLKVD